MRDLCWSSNHASSLFPSDQFQSWISLNRDSLLRRRDWNHVMNIGITCYEQRKHTSRKKDPCTLEYIINVLHKLLIFWNFPICTALLPPARLSIFWNFPFFIIFTDEFWKIIICTALLPPARLLVLEKKFQPDWLLPPARLSGTLRQAGSIFSRIQMNKQDLIRASSVEK